MLLFIETAISGERQFAANINIFWSMPSIPVALEVSTSSNAGYIEICIIWNLIVNIINKFSKI